MTETPRSQSSQCRHRRDSSPMKETIRLLVKLKIYSPDSDLSHTSSKHLNSTHDFVHISNKNISIRVELVEKVIHLKDIFFDDE